MRLAYTLAPLFALGAIAGAAATEVDYIRDTGTRATVVMPYCGTEDGSDYPNQYCLWVDPDTGRGYVNDYTAGATAGRGAE